ncbi:MAG: radical SAM protein [Candidatus Lokiarchaeota archaeon]|nr:radical SAM protein [Candidatus Lokiarchaeota archaeon]MBD3200015.1 radical SAM protein [Candidatus Lokiarchaeota archaeon]
MNDKLIYVDEKSEIPLFGLDFIGLIDRGTNLIEIKPLTFCNLKCEYCFVSCGAYSKNFILDPNFIISQLKKLIEWKGAYDIEIHIAPYGEIFLYEPLFELLDKLWSIDGIEIISMQTNGVMLSPEIITKLEAHNLTRLNISLNTFNQELAAYLTNSKSYNINKLVNIIDRLLKSNIDVLLAPVWFPGINEKDIRKIIEYVFSHRSQGFTDKELQIGIQKYLIYKTGRKLKKIRPKTWGYFYKQLSELEKEFNLKLKLGPRDFGLHERPIYTLDIKEGEIIDVKIISQGRWKNECIGKITSEFATKILLNTPLEFSPKMIQKQLKVKVIKSSTHDNIITSFIPF